MSRPSMGASMMDSVTKKTFNPQSLVRHQDIGKIPTHFNPFSICFSFTINLPWIHWVIVKILEILLKCSLCFDFQLFCVIFISLSPFLYSQGKIGMQIECRIVQATEKGQVIILSAKIELSPSGPYYCFLQLWVPDLLCHLRYVQCTTHTWHGKVHADCPSRAMGMGTNIPTSILYPAAIWLKPNFLASKKPSVFIIAEMELKKKMLKSEKMQTSKWLVRLAQITWLICP